MAEIPEHKTPEEQWQAVVQFADRQALLKLYDLYAAPLFGGLMRILRNEKEAEHILVDGWVTVWQKASSYQPSEKPFFHWVAAVFQEKALLREKDLHGKNSAQTLHFLNLAELVEVAVEPRPKVKEKLQERLSELELQKKAAAHPEISVYKAPELHFNHKKRDKYQWLLAVCFTLLVISNIVSFYIYQRWKRTQNQLEDAETEQLRLTENGNKAQEKIAQLQTALVILEDDQMQRIQLKGQPKSPESLAYVHYNPKNHQVFLELKQLPLPPDHKQYQLWALDKNGKPINAGLVDVATSLEGMLQMKPIRQGRTFLLTLESSGGSSEPSLSNVYLLGKL